MAMAPLGWRQANDFARHAAGVAPPNDVESRDLTKLVSGQVSDWDNRSVWKKGNQSFIVRESDKLVRGNVDGHVVYELYNLDADPLEQRNLIDEAARHQTIEALRAELDTWHEAQDEKGRLRAGTSV